MGRILWVHVQIEYAPNAHPCFNPLTNGADIVGVLSFSEQFINRFLFQSPDQWGGYCGEALLNQQQEQDQQVSIP